LHQLCLLALHPLLLRVLLCKSDLLIFTAQLLLHSLHPLGQLLFLLCGAPQPGLLLYELLLERTVFYLPDADLGLQAFNLLQCSRITIDFPSIHYTAREVPLPLPVLRCQGLLATVLGLDRLLHLPELLHLLLLHLWIPNVQKLLQMHVLLLAVPQLLSGPAQILVTSHHRHVVTTAMLWRFLLDSTRMFAKQPSHLLGKQLELGRLLKPSIDI